MTNASYIYYSREILILYWHCEAEKRGGGGKQISPEKMPLKIFRENVGKSLRQKLVICLEKFREMFRHLFRKCF